MATLVFQVDRPRPRSLRHQGQATQFADWVSAWTISKEQHLRRHKHRTQAAATSSHPLSPHWPRRGPAVASLAVLRYRPSSALSPFHRCRCRDLSPRCHRTHCSGQQRRGRTSAAYVRCRRRTWSTALAGHACDGSVPEEREFPKQFRRRGALRISCCGAHIATQGQCMTLVRSCSERAGGRARPQNVIHARDEMESVRRRSRWTPRRPPAASASSQS